MELPEIEVIEVHYWTLLVKDEFKPSGTEWPARFATKVEAEEQLRYLRDKNFTRS